MRGHGDASRRVVIHFRLCGLTREVGMTLCEGVGTSRYSLARLAVVVLAEYLVVLREVFGFCARWVADQRGKAVRAFALLGPHTVGDDPERREGGQVAGPVNRRVLLQSFRLSQGVDPELKHRMLRSFNRSRSVWVGGPGCVTSSAPRTMRPPPDLATPRERR